MQEKKPLRDAALSDVTILSDDKVGNNIIITLHQTQKFPFLLFILLAHYYYPPLFYWRM